MFPTNNPPFIPFASGTLVIKTERIIGITFNGRKPALHAKWIIMFTSANAQICVHACLDLHNEHDGSIPD